MKTCQWETLVGVPGRGGGFIRCNKPATWKVDDGKGDVKDLCPGHKGLVNRRVRKYGQVGVTFTKQ